MKRFAVNSWSFRKFSSLGVLIMLATCSELTGTAPTRAIAVEFTSYSSASSVTAPWVSIADSVILDVKSGSGKGRSISSQALKRGINTASFSPTVYDGPAKFDARVVSTNGITLFSGSRNSDVSGADTHVTVTLLPNAPVLLVAPDTARNSTFDGKITYATFAVHNRGLDSLIWTVKDTLPLTSTSQCGTRGCVRLAPNHGALAAGQSITMLLIRQTSVPFSAPITFVIASQAGDVSIVTLPF